VLHAGTRADGEGRVVTSGGRVLAVTAVGKDVADARAKAYDGVALLRIDGSHHRTDIAAGV
jgi:phosphoribosylamine--glycine ligase